MYPKRFPTSNCQKWRVSKYSQFFTFWNGGSHNGKAGWQHIFCENTWI